MLVSKRGGELRETEARREGEQKRMGERGAEIEAYEWEQIG